MSFTITTVTAFIHRDKNNEEGIMSIRHGDQHWPLIFADATRAKALYPMAKSTFPEIDFRIVEFSVRTDVTEKWLLEFGETITSINPDGSPMVSRIWKAPEQP